MILEKRFRYATYLGLVAAAVSRAPTLISDGKVFEVPLNINVGYVVLFGPLLFLLFYFDAYRVVSSGSQPIEDAHTDRVTTLIIFAPAVIGAFLVLQYLLNIRMEGNCDSQSFPRELFFRWEDFKTAYCINTNADYQDSMPHILKPPPLMTAFQLLIPALCLFLAWKIRSQVTRPKS